MSTLRSHRDARVYLVGQAFSLFGDSSMWLVCGIWIKSLTGSNGAAGMSFFFFSLPALLAPLAGMLVDRVRRRRLLVVANLAALALLAPLLFVHDAGQVWVIYAVMLLYGALNIVIAPAQSALLAGMLPAELLGPANAVLRTAQEGLRIVAPLLGAGLFALFGGKAVVLLDMATFVIAAFFCLLLRYREPRPGPRVATRLRTEVAAGFRFIAGNAVLRRTTIATAVAMLVIGFGESTSFAVVGALHRDPTFLGVTQTVRGAGAIVGGLVAVRLMRRLGEVRLVSLGLAGFAAGCLLSAAPVLGVVLVGMPLSGMALPWIVIGLLTLLQRLSPHDIQGRVYGAFELGTTGPQTVSIALGAVLVTVLDYRVLLLTEAVTLLVAAALMLRGHRAPAPPTAPALSPSSPVSVSPSSSPSSPSSVSPAEPHRVAAG